MMKADTMVRRMRSSACAAVFVAVALAIAAAAPAHAVEISNFDQIFEIVSIAASSNSMVDLDRKLREFAEAPGPSESAADSDLRAVIWFENWNPRARIVIKDMNATRMFNQFLAMKDLENTVDLNGKIDLELEIRTGTNPSIEGRLKMNDVSFHWHEGRFSLRGVNGYIPFRRVFDNRFNREPVDILDPSEIRVDALVWNDRVVASGFTAKARYENKILKFEQFQIDFLGGKGIGSFVLDHRSEELRMVSAVHFENVNLIKLPDILPGIPYFARVTLATMKGNVILSYVEPNYLNLSGEIASVAPGVIELSPLMKENAGGLVESRIIQFQKLVIKLGHDEKQQPEASILLYQRTAQSIAEWFRGVPFRPVMLTIKIPIVPFVAELSKER